MKKFLLLLFLLPLAIAGREIDEIIVHCTASGYMQDIGAAELRSYHTGVLGWDDIGYHYVIRLDGTVETGRDVALPGAHCRGHNAHSIGIVYVGGLDAQGHPADTRTEAQRIAMQGLVAELQLRFGNLRISGHRDYAPKACPCFDVEELRRK